LVTAALSSELLSDDRVAVCGPEAMARAVWSACSAVKGVESWYSLETAMACGVGSCHGCVIPLADGSLARACLEGPVFAGEDVWGRACGGSQGEVERR
jgi:dihydroorotate dehydrogenase electron transfer subunit